MTDTVDILAKRGDTKRHTFTVYKSDGATPEDISSWTSFVLAINSEKFPVDATNEKEKIVGFLTTDGTDGKMSFSPAGTLDIGVYFYNTQAIDGNSEKTTPTDGKYTVKQDIAKD